jgi:hypothetical protein
MREWVELTYNEWIKFDNKNKENTKVWARYKDNFLVPKSVYYKYIPNEKTSKERSYVFVQFRIGKAYVTNEEGLKEEFETDKEDVKKGDRVLFQENNSYKYFIDTCITVGVHGLPDLYENHTCPGIGCKIIGIHG